MKPSCRLLFLAVLAFAAMPNARAAAGSETGVVESATEVVQSLTSIPESCIPPALIRDAQGIAIIPGVLKAGFVIGARHGRGVVLARLPDGSWSNPLFLTVTGASVGWQIGVQSTDLVLIFKTRKGVERLLEGKGKLTLGGDLSVAAGPIGRDAQAATDVQLKAEILSYSRSRGLFAGLSVEGAVMLVDTFGSERFYGVRTPRTEDLLNLRGPGLPLCVEQLKGALVQISGPVMPPPPVLVPAPIPGALVPVPPPPPLPMPSPVPPPPLR